MNLEIIHRKWHLLCCMLPAKEKGGAVFATRLRFTLIPLAVWSLGEEPASWPSFWVPFLEICAQCQNQVTVSLFNVVYIIINFHLGNWWKIVIVDDEEWCADWAFIKTGTCTEDLWISREASTDTASQEQLPIADGPIEALLCLSWWNFVKRMYVYIRI